MGPPALASTLRKACAPPILNFQQDFRMLPGIAGIGVSPEISI